jgi:hypothetical protein
VASEHSTVWIYKTIRWFYVAVFLYAGISKLMDIDSFVSVIEAFGVVPDILLGPVAIGLPLLEVITATGLLFDRRVSLYLTVGLLALFLIILGYGIQLGLDIDCGCFGPSDTDGEVFGHLRQAFFRNLVLLAGGLSMVLLNRRLRRTVHRNGTTKM